MKNFKVTGGLTVIVLIAVFLQCNSFETGTGFKDFSNLPGEPYLGQTPPGAEREIFAPNYISTGFYTRDTAFMPDANELYYSIFYGGQWYILFTKLKDGKWSEPEIAPFSGRYNDVEPCITPDGQKLLFLSNRPDEGQEERRGWIYQDIWAVDRIADGWGEPYNLKTPVNTEAAEFFPSVTNDGTLYFTRVGEDRVAAIYMSRLVEGNYTEPEKLSENINTTPGPANAFIARDESYIISCIGGMEDSFGGVDFYISFRNEDGTWTEQINMGEKINNDRNANSPYVSPNGKYFFFGQSEFNVPENLQGSNITINKLISFYNGPGNGESVNFWIDASILEELKPVIEN